MPTPHKVRINPSRLVPAGDASLPSGWRSAVLAHLAGMTTTSADSAVSSTASHATPRSATALTEPTVSLKELAAELHVSRQTLYDLRSEGRGPRGFRVGRELRFRRSEIQAWLEWLEAEDTHCYTDAGPAR